MTKSVKTACCHFKAYMHKVKIYTTPTCVFCDLAKEFLNENNVAFDSVDVSVDEKAAQEMIDKTGQFGVPVIDVDGKMIIGFNKPELKKALGL